MYILPLSFISITTMTVPSLFSIFFVVVNLILFFYFSVDIIYDPLLYHLLFVEFVDSFFSHTFLL